MFKGKYWGLAWNVGDSLCSNVLEVHENTKKNCPQNYCFTTYTTFENKMLLYLNDKYFPTVINGDAPPNIQGAGNLDAGPVVMSSGDLNMGKRSGS